MDKQHIPDNKFYIILAIAILALVIGATGLIVGLQKPAQSSPRASSGGLSPSGTADGTETIEIDPSTGHGVAESPKKN